MTSSRSPRSAGKLVVMRGLITGLLCGDWAGGMRLTEVEATEKFGVSRTPVREALLEMQGLGLIELRRNCGAVFLSFGPNEIREIYEVRSLLEVEATRLAAGRIPSPILESLVESFTAIRESGGIDPEWEHDRSLHRIIAESSGNRRLFSEINRYGEVIQTVRDIVSDRDYGIHETSADEHLAILRALQKGDPELAASAMRNHLAQASHSAAEAARFMRSRRAAETSTELN